jgi:tetratricopeptide (TPR) repeat protein
MSANSPLRAGILSGVALLVALLAFPSADYCQQRTITIVGQVTTADGSPVTSGAMATLATRQGVRVAIQPVNANGTFDFAAVQAATYILTVTADNFETYQQTIYGARFAPSYYTANVTLTPVAHRKVPVSSLPALTDEAAPKSARKEYEEGAAALQKHDLKKARQHLEKAVAEYPCYARAQTSLAEVDLADHQQDSAEAALKKATQCDGNFLDSFYMLANLYVTQKRYADSESVLKQGLRVLPSAWPLLNLMGRTHYAMGKYPEAAHDFEQAESFHPEMPADFHAELANTYVQTDQYGRALAEMETYLRLDPHGRFADSARRITESMRKQGVTPVPAPSGPSLPDRH